jgi:hypothetical protein
MDDLVHQGLNKKKRRRMGPPAQACMHELYLFVFFYKGQVTRCLPLIFFKKNSGQHIAYCARFL